MKAFMFITLLLVNINFSAHQGSYKIVKVVEEYQENGVMIYYAKSDSKTFKIIDDEFFKTKHPLETGKNYNLTFARHDTITIINGIEFWTDPGQCWANLNPFIKICPDDSLRGIYLLLDVH